MPENMPLLQNETLLNKNSNTMTDGFYNVSQSVANHNLSIDSKICMVLTV